MNSYLALSAFLALLCTAYAKISSSECYHSSSQGCQLVWTASSNTKATDASCLSVLLDSEYSPEEGTGRCLTSSAVKSDNRCFVTFLNLVCNSILDVEDTDECSSKVAAQGEDIFPGLWECLYAPPSGGRRPPPVRKAPPPVPISRLPPPIRIISPGPSTRTPPHSTPDENTPLPLPGSKNGSLNGNLTSLPPTTPSLQPSLQLPPDQAPQPNRLPLIIGAAAGGALVLLAAAVVTWYWRTRAAAAQQQASKLQAQPTTLDGIILAMPIDPDSYSEPLPQMDASGMLPDTSTSATGSTAARDYNSSSAQVLQLISEDVEPLSSVQPFRGSR